MPRHLEQGATRTDGWWTDDTLGAMVARRLGGESRPDGRGVVAPYAWKGTYADVGDRRGALIALLRVRHGVQESWSRSSCRTGARRWCRSALALGGYVLVPIVHIYGRKEVGFILEQSGAVAYVAARLRPRRLRRDRRGRGTAVAAAARRGRRRRHRRSRITSRACRGPACRARTATRAAARARRRRRASSPSGHDQRPEGRDPRPPHDARRAAPMADYMTRDALADAGSPVTHATGMLGAVLGPLVTDQAIHLIDRWDPTHVLEVMREAQVGSGTGASVFLASLIDHPDFTARRALINRVGLGGAPGAGRARRACGGHGITIIRAYGSTEHPSTTGASFDDPAEIRHRTDGRALGAVELVSWTRTDDVPVGTPGEIPVARPGPLPGLHRSRAHRGRVRRRRLVPHRRRRRARRVGCLDDHRPRQGHHHPRRRERLRRGGRERAAVAGRCRGGRGRRGTGRASRRARVRRAVHARRRGAADARRPRGTPRTRRPRAAGSGRGAARRDDDFRAPRPGRSGRGARAPPARGRRPARARGAAQTSDR